MIKNATIYTFTGPLPTFDELAFWRSELTSSWMLAAN